MKIPIKNFYNYSIDFLLLYGFILIFISSFVLWFVIPMATGLGGDYHCDDPYTGRGEYGNILLVFGLSRWQWVELHSWISLIITAIILIHTIFHWQWVIESFNRIKAYFLKQQKIIIERYVVAILLFISTGIEVLSGFILWIVIPRGRGDLDLTQAGYGRSLWGLQRNEWVDLHAWVAVFMLAIIIVHLVIHWRWILNMIQGKIKPNKANSNDSSENLYSIDDVKTINELKNPDYLNRLGALIGIVGAVGFTVAMATFQLDETNKYGFALFLIPIPFISIIFAKKWPFVNGGVLIILSIMSIAMYFIFPIGIVWNQIGVWNVLGWETIYTLVFVTLPLLSAGILILLSAILNKKRKFLS